MGLRIGFAGLGLMGWPMTRRLLRAGYRVVVYNRTRDKAVPLVAEGAEIADSPADLSRRTDIVLLCLATVEASEQVFLGESGVVAGTRPGQVLVDHGTMGPDTARRFADAAAERGARFLDAPVSGGPEGAEAGALTIMVGGAAEAFREAEPVFRALGANVRHMGETGAGSIVKLINQLLTLVHGAAAAEALALAGRAGVDMAALLEVLRTSFGQSRMLERLAARLTSGDFEAGAPLRLYAKDADLLRRLGRKLDAPLTLTETAERQVHQAIRDGFADKDISALFLLADARAGHTQ